MSSYRFYWASASRRGLAIWRRDFLSWRDPEAERQPFALVGKNSRLPGPSVSAEDDDADDMRHGFVAAIRNGVSSRSKLRGWPSPISNRMYS